MMKVINELDIRIASNIERCELLIAIIRRRSGIHTRFKNSLKGVKNMKMTNETRKESNEKTEEIRPILYTKILAILSAGETLTANEIAKRINKNWSRQNVQPRLHELQNRFGLIEENGTKHDYETHRNVTAYRLVEGSSL